MNKKFAMSIMAHGNQEQHFSTFGCNYMQLIMTASPIKLPSGFSDSHTFYEFMVPLSEIPGFQIDGREVKCQPGTLIPINPGQKHGVNRGQSKVSYILILFEQEIMDRMVRQISGNPFSCRFPSQPASLASDIRSEERRGGEECR